MANSEFELPDVGEGLTEAEIVSWKVKPGDTVEINQVIVEIETAKSLVELPSPFAGTVSALLVEEGQTVEVGTPIISVDGGGASPAHAEPAVDAAAETVAEQAARVAAEGPGAGAAGPYGGGEPAAAARSGEVWLRARGVRHEGTRRVTPPTRRGRGSGRRRGRSCGGGGRG